MAEMLATTGSAEITEWVAEFSIRDEDEIEAITRAREEREQS